MKRFVATENFATCDISADEAIDGKVQERGFAKFNGAPHLLVNVPRGNSTISVLTPEGRKVTFAFMQYEENGEPQCVDIKQHDMTAVVNNGDLACPIQETILFSCGRDAYRSKYTDARPVTLMTLLLKPSEKHRELKASEIK